MDNKIQLIQALASVAEELDSKKLKKDAKNIDSFIAFLIGQAEQDLKMKKESQLLPLKDRNIAIGTGIGAGATGGAALGGKLGKGFWGKLGGGLIGGLAGGALGAGAGYLATEPQSRENYIQQIDDEIFMLKKRIEFLEREKTSLGENNNLNI